jgi:hypothetical protein
MLSTRRRKNVNTPVNELSFESFDLPPYNYILPVDYRSMVSYNLKLNGLK